MTSDASQVVLLLGAAAAAAAAHYNIISIKKTHFNNTNFETKPLMFWCCEGYLLTNWNMLGFVYMLLLLLKMCAFVQIILIYICKVFASSLQKLTG